LNITICIRFQKLIRDEKTNEIGFKTQEVKTINYQVTLKVRLKSGINNDD